MSSTTDRRMDPNAPLPRVDKNAAVKWAEEYTTYLARLTGVELDPPTARANFEACLGRNDEVAIDGRYSLFYYVNSPAPVTEHTHVVRTLRRELPQQGYEVTAYREFENAYASAVFRARDTRSSYLVTADTVGSGRTKPQRLSFAVRTPCLLPPGAEQQQF
ncbi:hypothetical protein PO587_30490 [Streptomyces gilvifuscus]|uniref:Uncharacterized protein n=1 Tax=Streptomyces gilvifuscus TaxID=1550617 RepID=A0ABT5G1R6_9ACTN|nr:hypothetical protein [Streptomyces gilvifuscus]MDC2958777.1 hypothetical protein [Streptomyces gilvifuscus]